MKNLSLKNSRHRTFLFLKKEKLKMLPLQYVDIPLEVLYSFIADFDRIYLNNAERFLCELFLFKNDLMNNDSLVYDLIKDCEILDCRFVHIKFGTDRCELVFENNMRVKCHYMLFDFYHYQNIIKSQS